MATLTFDELRRSPVQSTLDYLNLNTPERRVVVFSLLTYGALSILKPNIAYENGRPRSFGPGFWPFDKQGSIITPTIISVGVGFFLANIV